MYCLLLFIFIKGAKLSVIRYVYLSQMVKGTGKFN